MSEATLEGSVRPAITENRFKSVLNAFKRKFQNRPPSEKQETVVSYEQSAPEQAERLRPAKKVFYHTTPADRFDSIKKEGLFSPVDDPNIGSHLGYSVHFGYEHALLRNNISVGIAELEGQIPDNYILTVWENSRNLTKSKELFENRMGLRRMANTVNRKDVPGQFFASVPAGHPVLFDGVPVGRLGPEHLLAGIQLHRSNRDQLTRLLVLARYGKINADQVEVSLTELLSKNSGVWLKSNTTVDDFAHSLTVSIEQDLMRTIVMGKLSEIKKRGYMSKYEGYYLGSLAEGLWLVSLYRQNVNDPVSARYLDSAKKLIEKDIALQGDKPEEVNLQVKQMLTDYKSSQKIPDYHWFSSTVEAEGEYFGATGGEIAAVRIKKELGI